MARRKPIVVGAALAVLLVVSAATSAEDKCRSGCKGAPTIFKYQEGTTYKYNFDSKIEVSLSSAENQKTTTEVKGQVLLTQLGDCNQILKVQNLQVLTSDGKKHGTIPDIDKPIRITNQDGHLEDSICTVPGDTQNSLNVKRAIASLLQANPKATYETDVFGLCPTETTEHKEGDILTIQKARNLNRCAYRESIKQDFFATAFNLNSEIKSSPLLNGDYRAKLRLKNGVVDLATVTEEYLYVPFSVGSNGAKTIIETTLKLTGNDKSAPNAKVSVAKSIIFEDPHPVVSPKANVNSILNAVKEVAKTVTATVSDNTAKEFVNLVKILRVSKKDDLLAVFSQVKAGVGFSDKQAARRIFLDGLLRAGNGDTVEAALTLLKSNELSPLEQKLIYLGLNFVRHTTEHSLVAAEQLAKQNIPREAFLGIGNLAGKHCKQHSCKNVEAVNKLIQTFVQKIGNGKADNRNKENDIVYSLKALANIGHLTDQVVGKIAVIAQDKSAVNRVRVAALEALLSDPCKDKVRDVGSSVLKDVQQDSEIRIRAYLLLVQCPTAKSASVIKAVIDHEESYQVGGFIATHIKNLRSSANPDKDLAKQHLGQINVNKKFPFDLRKYSANGEFSYSIDTLGLANSVEGNVIYSQKSWLPRATSLNLTADVFGHTFNFLEVETRQENLDGLLEHYFGPKSLLRTEDMEELLTNKGETAKKLFNKIREKVQNSLRQRRDVSKGELDKIIKAISIKTSELNKDLDLDVSFKIFGQEVLFWNINGDPQKFSPDALVDNIVKHLNEGLDKLKNFDETLRSNLMFLDAEFAYPTSSGFPLRLGVEGSASVQVKASGQVDVRKIFTDITNHKTKISIVPSANVEVAGRLTIDTQSVENGLKVISSLHTATGGDLTLELMPHGVDVKFSLPVEKHTILSAQHNIVFHTRELGQPEKNQLLKFQQNKDFEICLDQLKPLVGLTVCAEAAGPNVVGKQVPVLPFPLSGDAKVSLYILKEDVSQYHFRHVFYDSQNKVGTQLNIEALDNAGQKKFSFDVDAFLIPEKVVKATLKSPIVDAAVEGRITNTEQEKSISALLKYDQNEFSGKIGVGIEGSPARSAYKPIFYYKTPKTKGLQTPPYRIEGQVVVEQTGPSSKFTFDNVKLILPSSKFTWGLNGHIGSEPETLFADLTASDGKDSATLKGKLQANPNLVKYNVEVTNSLNPDANINAKGELARNKNAGEIKHSVQVIHGRDLASKTNILKVDNSFKYKNKNPQDYLVDLKNKLTYPLLSLDLQFDLKVDPKDVEYNLLTQYRDLKFGSELEFERVKKPDGTDYDLDFEIYGLKNKVEVKSKRKVQGQTSQIDNSVEVNGQKWELNGKVTHNLKPNDIDTGADLTIKTPSLGPIKVLYGLKLNSNELDYFDKVSSGTTVYLDVFLKTNKNGDANGSLKVNLKDKLVINGQIKANKGTGNGDITVELPGIKKTSKADLSFTIKEPQYNVNFNIYPIFDQDKTKKISFNTNTKATLSSIDSKSSLNIIDHEIAVNIKGDHNGDWFNGKITGDVDVTLPDGHYLAAKLTRDIKTTDGVINGNMLVTAECRKNKNAPGAKVTASATAKNTDMKNGLVDLEYKITAESGTGKDIQADISIKKSKQEPLSTAEITTRLTGSVLPTPIDAKWVSNCQKLKADIQLVWSGLDRTGKSTLKTDFTDKLIGEMSMTYSAPKSEVLKSFDVIVGGTVAKVGGVDATGSASLVAHSPKEAIVEFTGVWGIVAKENEARIKLSGGLAKDKQMTLNTGYVKSEEKGHPKIQADLDLTLPQGKNVKANLDWEKTSMAPRRDAKFDIKLSTPLEQLKDLRVQGTYQGSEDTKQHQQNYVVTLNGKTATIKSNMQFTELEPLVDISVKGFNGKQCQLFAKIRKPSSNQFGAELKLVSEEKNFKLEGDFDAAIQSVDEFHLKGHLNCPALSIDKTEIDIQNKGGKAAKKILVSVKQGGKSVLSGSSSYSTREEHGKLIVEGSGTFKVKEDSKSANFKFIKQNLRQEKNGETGIEISFDASLGKKAVDAEFKATNKQFRIANSYCEEKEQCAHLEIDAKTITNEIANFNHELEITVDLRKLGMSHEFGLKAVTTRKDYQLDHTVDVHFQSQANSKYQYSLYLHPKEAGWSLTTPKRVVALEAKLELPPQVFKNGGKITGDISLYLDKKNQPTKKSGVLSYLNINPQGTSLDGEIKFTNPGLQRPLLISFKSQLVNKNELDTELVLDIFAQPAQKIVVKNIKNVQYQEGKQFQSSHIVEIKSTGLNINIRAEEKVTFNREKLVGSYNMDVKYKVGGSNYNSAVSLDASGKTLSALVKLLNIELLKMSSKFQIQEKQQIVDTELVIVGSDKGVSHLEIKNLNTLKYALNYKNYKLNINAGFIPGQIADFRAQINNAELAHASVKLDEANFLKPDYNINTKNIKELLLKPTKEETIKIFDGAKNKAVEINKDVIQEAKNLGELAKKAIPNLVPVKTYYQTELKKIKDEILADKTVHDISELLHNLIAAASQVFGDFFNSASELIESLAKTFHQSFAKILETIEKEILPKIKEIADKSYKTLSHSVEQFLDAVLSYLVKIGQVAEKLQPQIKELATVIGEASQDLVRVWIKALQSIKDIIIEQWRKLYNELKAWPIVNTIKEEYDNIINSQIFSSENLANTLKDLFSTLRDLAPTEELKKLLDSLSTYIHQKLTNQKVDDLASLQHIGQEIAAVVKNLVAVLGTTEGTEIAGFKIPMPVNIFNRLPRIVASRFSPISYILKEEVPDTTDFLLSLINRPRNLLLPFPLYGLVAQGQHIFTFDGKHLTFPGKCSYILAHDAVDDNFTVVGTYENGLLGSITLVEGKDSVTLKKGGQVLLNNSPTELPARKPNIAAFRDYEKFTLTSSSGVTVLCGPELVACSVTASGFYHGKLRGLLGNGNNDPYDDFTQANGKIVTSDSDFGNSFKVGAGCPAVTTVQHAQGHHSAPSCDKLFGQDSTLRLCYWFVRPEIFKLACEHGLATGVKDTELAIAVAYTAACKNHGIPVRVPDEFVRCTNGDKENKLGDKFSVKTPGKAADIVLLVDTVKKNEQVYKDLVGPLVTQLTADLAQKGVTDVEFSLITYGGENQWPSHVTVDGKLHFKNKVPDVKFAENPKKSLLETGCRYTDRFLEITRTVVTGAELALGLDLQARTYSEGFKHPFRPNAIKSIIAVTGNPCRTGVFFPIQVLRTLLYRDKSINLNLFTPFATQAFADDKHAKDVVGFNSQTVFTAGAKGKKNTELHKELEYPDYCVGFTVHNGGNVFILDKFNTAKGPARKQFVQTAAHNIAEQYVSQEQGLDCECRMVTPFSASNVCHVVHIKPKV